jgi:CRP/FNR family transcriptional regulator
MPTEQSTVVHLADVKVACEKCSLHQLCLPMGLESDDVKKLDHIIKRKRPLQRGEYLFQCDDPFKSVYAIRSGSFKTFTTTSDGEEQITGFHLPGELVGLDALTSGKHRADARALETCSVCEIPYDRLEDLSRHIVGLQRQLLRIMSREILEDQDMMIWLGKKSAEERLALLLLRISSRFRERGFSPTEFNLSMSRTDIANYLGLAVETVSRLFSRFQESGIMTVERKHVRIHDLAGMEKLARHTSTGCHSSDQQA